MTTTGGQKLKHGPSSLFDKERGSPARQRRVSHGPSSLMEVVEEGEEAPAEADEQSWKYYAGAGDEHTPHSRLRDGHMLSIREMETLEQIENLFSKLADGHLLTKIEMSILEEEAEDAFYAEEEAPSPEAGAKRLSKDATPADVLAAASSSDHDADAAEPWRSADPGCKLLADHPMLLRRDYATRLAGEGHVRLASALGNSDDDDAATVELIATDTPISQRQIEFNFDLVSQIVLPWPVPVERPLERFIGKTEAQLDRATESIRGVILPGLSRYAVGQELTVFVDRLWSDAIVLVPPDPGSTVHKVQAQGAHHHVMLTPWNHAPQLIG